MESGECRVQSVGCRVWIVKRGMCGVCGVWSVRDKVWSGECGVWSVKCGGWSVKCGSKVWSVECGVESVQCGV